MATTTNTTTDGIQFSVSELLRLKLILEEELALHSKTQASLETRGEASELILRTARENTEISSTLLGKVMQELEKRTFI